MNDRRHKLRLAIVLLLPSVAAYAIHYAIFRNAHDIFYYLLMDIAFLFVQGLLVTLVIEELLSARERRAILMKQNVVIGVFYSEVGTPLVRLLSGFDVRADELGARLRVSGRSSPRDFAEMRVAIRKHESSMDGRRGDLAGLKALLEKERGFLVRLLENPNLLEHDAFTELLWAVFHLAEEMALRPQVSSLAEADRKHIEGDVKRAHDLLVREWLAHLEHLQTHYPYLYSLAVRTNPFDPAASVEVR